MSYIKLKERVNKLGYTLIRWPVDMQGIAHPYGIYSGIYADGYFDKFKDIEEWCFRIEQKELVKETK